MLPLWGGVERQPWPRHFPSRDTFFRPEVDAMSRLGTFAVLLMWSSGSVTTGQTGAPPDEAAVRSAIEVLQSAWNSHDMTLYMSVISSNANFVNVNGWWWQGHNEIKTQTSRLMRQRSTQ